MTSIALILPNPTTPPWHYAKIFYTVFYQNLFRNTKSVVSNSYTPISKARRSVEPLVAQLSLVRQVL